MSRDRHSNYSSMGENYLGDLFENEDGSLLSYRYFILLKFFLIH